MQGRLRDRQPSGEAVNSSPSNGGGSNLLNTSKGSRNSLSGSSTCTEWHGKLPSARELSRVLAGKMLISARERRRKDPRTFTVYLKGIPGSL